MSDQSEHDQSEHDEFHRKLTELEQKALEEAVQLTRIELELGIFLPPPQILNGQDKS